MGKPEGRILLGKQRQSWEDIKLDFTETGWDGVDWIHLAEDRDNGRPF